jgi:hypothetical protein
MCGLHGCSCSRCFREEKSLKLWIAFFLILLSWASAWSQNACTVNCGDKCTRNVLGVQYRDPLCYNACLGEQAACGITGGQTLPDLVEIPRNLIRTACGLPHGVTLHYISSVCTFAPLSPADTAKIDAAKNELIAYGIVRQEEFQDVVISFCDNIHASGVVPDRDRVYLHTSGKSVSTKYLATLLGHEMMHVRQYRTDGTDNFKCTYTRQVGDCLISNATRGISNLLRDNFCQTRDQNAYERQAYDFQDQVQKILSGPDPRGVYATQSMDSTAGSKPRKTEAGSQMFCQLPRKRGHCQVVALAEGESCECQRILPPGTTGLTRGGGRATRTPTGNSWD